MLMMTSDIIKGFEGLRLKNTFYIIEWHNHMTRLGGKEEKFIEHPTSDDAIDGADNHESPIRVTDSLSPAVDQVIHGVDFILNYL